MVGGIGGGGGPTGPGKIGGPGAGAPVSPSGGPEKASFGETLGAKKVEGASGERHVRVQPVLPGVVTRTVAG